MARSLFRIVIPSPDGRRVLVRPNGLAGWTLPTIPVDHGTIEWTSVETERASRLLSTTVVPDRRLAPGVWVVRIVGRVPAAGNTWITADDAGRAGADAAAIRAWADSCTDPGSPAPPGGCG